VEGGAGLGAGERGAVGRELDAAFGGAEEAGEGAKQARLACTVGTCDRQSLSGLEIEGQALE
jgi:hypothetical protein